jgi:phage terminase large subunit-like protein
VSHTQLTRADRAIAFIERLKITIGEDEGKPFVLRPWQRKFIRDVLDPNRPDGRRLVRRAVLSMGRKNGKTELAGALILVFLIGPLAERNGEIYSAANDQKQAKIVFNVVKRFIEASPHLKQYLRVVDSTKSIFVTRSDVNGAGSVFRALSSEAGRQHGLNPSLVIVDELAQAKSRELFDTLATSQGARSEPLLMVISTQSHDPQHVLSEMIADGLTGSDPSTVCHLYAAPDGCDLLDEAAWAAANPALGDFLSLDEFRVAAQRAARMPSEEQAFRLLRLNQQVAVEATLINRADWAAADAGAFDFEPGESIYLGLDLSARFDLTSLVAVSAEDGSRVKSWHWKPGDLLAEHTARDRFRYDVHANGGHLGLCPGRSIDPMAVATKVAELCREFTVVGLAYDRWRIDELLRCFDAIGLEAQEGPGYGLRIETWGQGVKDMAPAVDAFEAAVVLGDLRHDGNAVLTFCVMNAIAVTDPAGNRKLDKSKSRFRIDGAVALAMALGLKSRDRAAQMPRSPWEDENFKLTVL